MTDEMQICKTTWFWISWKSIQNCGEKDTFLGDFFFFFFNRES